jgi:hypothetical protein
MKYLKAKFGDAYKAYRDRVPRWFSLKEFFDGSVRRTAWGASRRDSFVP